MWHLAQVREGAILGRDCVVGRGAYVGPGVHIADAVKVQNFAFVYEPATIDYGAFIGPASVALNSGTSGLHLGLLAAGIGRGDEVIVPSFTFAATPANAVVLAGAMPVFADIDPRCYCLHPAAVEAAITPRTAAVMPVHLFGHPADMLGLGAVADRHGLALFEDAA